MNNETYRFNVGDFQCIAVSDGTLAYGPPFFPPPAQFLFANAPREPLGQRLQQQGLNQEQWAEWISPYICLVVNTGKHLVLIDTGADGLGPNTGRLIPNLRSEEIEPDIMDSVILTHGHPDHVGGITDSEGRAAFPEAQFIMWKDEWDFWNSDERVLKIEEHSRAFLVALARKYLSPIRSQMRFIEKEGEILPGIEAIAAPGHTPGHMALKISFKGKTMWCVGDLVLHPVHLERVEWCATVDLDPVQLVQTRRRILTQVADEKALMMVFHFPFPGLGHITRAKHGWSWNPITKSA